MSIYTMPRWGHNAHERWFAQVGASAPETYNIGAKIYALVAQLVEQHTCNVHVRCSIHR